MPYLLIQRVVLPVTSVHVEASVLARNPVPHGAFKNMVVDKGHSEYRSVWQKRRKATSELLDQNGSYHLWLYRIKKIKQPPHIHISKPTYPLFVITTRHATIMPL